MAICRNRQSITFDQFALVINDLRLVGEPGDYDKRYAHEFGFTLSDLQRAMSAKPRHYTADERAQIFSLSYAERQTLALRRTGSIDVDKQGRERARRDRYNAKRRAARAEARTPGVNNKDVSSRKVSRITITRRIDKARVPKDVRHLASRKAVTPLPGFRLMEGDLNTSLLSEAKASRALMSSIHPIQTHSKRLAAKEGLLWLWPWKTPPGSRDEDARSDASEASASRLEEDGRDNEGTAEARGFEYLRRKPFHPGNLAGQNSGRKGLSCDYAAAGQGAQKKEGQPHGQ